MSKKGKVLLIFVLALILLAFALKLLSSNQEKAIIKNNTNQVEHTYESEDNSDFGNIDEGNS